MTPPTYRERLKTGVVHFGPGAFHRAHQADYFDRLLHHDPRWGIAAASLRSGQPVETLRSQDNLYTLAILDERTSFRTIGAHSHFLGPSDRASLRRLLGEPAVTLVTTTVTEKGYCLSGDGALDLRHPDVVHDLANPQEPRSLIGWLALGFADRRTSGLPPFTSICCDNMAGNGRKFADAVHCFTEQLDPDLSQWIADEARFPNTMIDSITPATDERLIQLVRKETGFDDRAPVAREAFAQWVIEDVLPAGSPDLASVGVILTDNVAEWERAKLRILNGSHSTLAYIGLLLGHDTVAQAMDDPLLRSFVERLIFEDIIPTLESSRIDLKSYAGETLARFRNPAINHRLSQIAWDGSQKLPYRILDTVIDALTAGRPVNRLALPIAAWIAFLVRAASEGVATVDPLAHQLASRARADSPVDDMLALRQVFPEPLAANPAFRSALETGFNNIRDLGVGGAVSKLLSP